MKLGSCIHFEELRSTLCSILRRDLFLRFTDKCRVFAFRSFSRKHETGVMHTSLRDKVSPMFNFET